MGVQVIYKCRQCLQSTPYKTFHFTRYNENLNISTSSPYCTQFSLRSIYPGVDLRKRFQGVYDLRLDRLGEWKEVKKEEP